MGRAVVRLTKGGGVSAETTIRLMFLEHLLEQAPPWQEGRHYLESTTIFSVLAL
jgi:hypothetical protein